jgi:hypothetical protein
MWTYPTTLLAGGAEPFDPLTDGAASELLVWWDASDNSTIFDSGGNPITTGTDVSVYQIRDKKNSFHADDYQATASLPTYSPGDSTYQSNGHDGAVFTEDQIYTSTGSGTPTYTDALKRTFVACWKYTTKAEGHATMGWGGSPWGNRSATGEGNTSSVAGFVNTLVTTWTETSSTSTRSGTHTTGGDTDPHVYGATINATSGDSPSLVVFYDDSDTAADTITFDWPYLSTSYTRLSLGAAGVVSGDALVGSQFIFYECLVYDGVISDADMKLAIDYMKSKFGV